MTPEQQQQAFQAVQSAQSQLQTQGSNFIQLALQQLAIAASLLGGGSGQECVNPQEN